jgi:DNA polymerase III epsilon subunit-like protein
MNYQKLYESWQNYLDEAEKFKFQSDSLQQQINEMGELKKIIEQGSIVYFDTETTGLTGDSGQIVQLAYTIKSKGVEKSENLIAFLTPESMEKFAFKKYDPQTKKYIDADNIKDKVINSLNKSLETIERKNSEGKYKPYEYQEKKSNVEKELQSAMTDGEYVKTHLDTQTRAVFLVNKYLEKQPQISEEDMLKPFINDVSKLSANKDSKVILCAHNITFDANFVNKRCAFYKIQSPLLYATSKEKKKAPVDPNDNIILLDSLMVSKTVYIDALIALEEKLKQEISNLIQQAQQEGTANNIKEIDAILPDDIVKDKQSDNQDKFKPADISFLFKELKQIFKDKKYSDINRRYATRKILIIATKNALQLGTSFQPSFKFEETENAKFSHKLGDLATTMKIDPEGAHDALADVNMLDKVFNGILASLTIAYGILFNEEQTTKKMIEELEILSEEFK